MFIKKTKFDRKIILGFSVVSIFLLVTLGIFLFNKSSDNDIFLKSDKYNINPSDVYDPVFYNFEVGICSAEELEGDTLLKFRENYGERQYNLLLNVDNLYSEEGVDWSPFIGVETSYIRVEDYEQWKSLEPDKKASIITKTMEEVKYTHNSSYIELWFVRCKSKDEVRYEAERVEWIGYARYDASQTNEKYKQRVFFDWD